MMTPNPQPDVAVLRIAKLKSMVKLGAAQRHNLRLIQCELGASPSIDQSRMLLNRRLVGGSASEVVARANERMKAAGVGKLRKDAVRAIEIVISLAPWTQIDVMAFFERCVPWVGANFGGSDNLLSADVHLDEGAPHAHFIVLPLVDGKMRGSDMVGSPRDLSFLQARFHADVAASFGLARATQPLRGMARKRLGKAVVAVLQGAADPVVESAVWPETRAAIEKAPEAFASRLGVTVEAPKQKRRTMTDIFISRGKGPARESGQDAKPGLRREREPYAL